MSSKRRRITGTDNVPFPGDRRPLSIADLPVEALTHVADYLAAPSRVLFDIALFSGDPTIAAEGRRAITGDQWDILDFGDVEKDLAVKLTDDDVQAVLLRVDAVNKVKRLKLTNCVNITGAGLEPLRGSAIIEQIDLSLVGQHQSPILNTDPQIRCGIVLPILDSIIHTEGFSLKHLQFPHVWRRERSTESEFHAFLGRYNEMWRNQGPRCLKCNCDLCEETFRGMCTLAGNYGEHAHTCFGCLNQYCYDCTNGYDDHMLRYCSHCHRDYCEDCLEMSGGCDDRGCNNDYCVGCRVFVVTKQCSGSECESMICHHCVEEGCNKCDKRWCGVCRPAPNILTCRYRDENVYINCKEVMCTDCNVDAGENGILDCEDCDIATCSACLLRECEEGVMDCEKCIKHIAPLLLDENKKLHREVGQLKDRIKELEDRNKELQIGNG
jgi:hypothetical protein